VVRTLTFSYNHKLKVLTPISAIKFGLAVSDVLFSSFKKGCVETDDSYVEGTRCSIFPLAAPNSKGAPRELAEKPQPLKRILIFILQKKDEIRKNQDYGLPSSAILTIDSVEDVDVGHRTIGES